MFAWFLLIYALPTAIAQLAYFLLCLRLFARSSLAHQAAQAIVPKHERR